MGVYSFHDRINVLGAPASAITSDFDRGYGEAIDACLEVAEDADAVVEELIECIEDILLMRDLRLDKWAESATRLLESIKHRRSK